MLDFLEKFRKEWPTIRAAPWSFVTVVVISCSICFAGFQYYYGSRLADADSRITDSEKRAAQWKSDVDHWKDVASRSKPTDCPQSDKAAAVPDVSRSGLWVSLAMG